jgi:hypothetical protein
MSGKHIDENLCTCTVWPVAHDAAWHEQDPLSLVPAHQ